MLGILLKLELTNVNKTFQVSCIEALEIIVIKACNQ